MLLSDTSVKRPVFASVVNLLLIAFGIIAFTKLPLREYPDIDPPIVSIDTTYTGAAANVVETRITQPIEDRIAGIEGIKTITSQSQDGRSRISVEFNVNRNIDDAANDIRDRVSSAANTLPEEADPPQVQKADSNDDVILWFTLSGENMDIMQLTDYAHRYIEDRFSAIDGVARIRVGGGQETSLRIWLDRNALAARGLTAQDVETALESENLELPAGSIESLKRDFTVRMKRGYTTPDDFQDLVIKRGAAGYLVRLKDVARVELAPVEKRTLLRGNGVPTVGVGIIKQSKANTLDVARLAKAVAAQVDKTLPKGMHLSPVYDTSVFIEYSVREVYKTLIIAALLVIAVIYAFLGSWKATLVPALTVPVSLIGTFIILFACGFSLNLLTLLAFVLAIGLVVDDAIVVIENIHRRVELGEPRLLAAYRGTRQVGFAVVATTVVLISVFIPITFLEGNIGRLFREFALAIAGAVGFSGFTALTFSPMLASKVMERHGETNRFTHWLDGKFDALRQRYVTTLEHLIDRPSLSIALLIGVVALAVILGRTIPGEFVPQEDRGSFFIKLTGPEGASYNYVMEHLDEVEKRLQPMVKSGEIKRLLARAPASFGGGGSFNDANITVILADWGKRKPMAYYLKKVRELTADITGVRIAPIQRQAFGRGVNKPVQFVIGGPTYDELVKWRDIILDKARNNKKLLTLEHDYKETKPQIGITVDRDRAGDLGVPADVINNTLESMLGSRKVTTFIDRGEEYDVILESEKNLKQSPLDISNIYVRSTTTNQLIPLSNLMTISEFADVATLNRYNRLRSITLEAGLVEGYSLSEALDYLEGLVKDNLPPEAQINYKGMSLEYKSSGTSVYFIFAMALVVVYLVLAGQFESFIHPLIIMLTVPLAITGALIALWFTGSTLNIYSQIGLIILVGIAAKNGILIVEFTNQLRDEGIEFRAALLDASSKRLRPIIMTSICTAMGAVPLILSSGAGAETRQVIGIVIFAGIIVATCFTVFVIPAMYQLLAKNTKSPLITTRRLEGLLKEHKEQV